MKKLKDPAFSPLSLNKIKPEGWLLNQLRIQADGLSGNLDLFWDDIKSSKWIGGSCEGWERMPYWLDGFIPLAWLLNDYELKKRALEYVDYILRHQHEDGWIGPTENSERDKYDIWAMFLILKVLIVYYDATKDDRVQPAVRKALLSLDSHIDSNTLFNWGQTRYFECLISVFWLYDRDPEEWLLHFASKLISQGFDWQSFYKQWPYKKADCKGRWSQMSHVVNNAMMLKSGALKWRMTGLKDDRNSAYEMLKSLDSYHGMVTGIFSGDECLSGKSPVQGTELCAVAELMYSFEQLLSITGDSSWGDRLEKLAFNALPATFSPDMWTHQYDQQVNQVQCITMESPPFYTNGGQSNLFGLEPNFGCCTANFNQAWPKFASSIFMTRPDGVVFAVYAPASVETKINGTPVEVKLETDYPFKQELNFTVSVKRETEFAIYLRIPEWAEKGIITINGQKIYADSDQFYRLFQKWSGKTQFKLTLPMKVKIENRPNHLFAITRGPLIYSLPIGEKWIQINKSMPGHEFPHCDYELYPTTNWNYGLVANIGNSYDSFSFTERPLGKYPFSPEGAPVICKAKGKRIDWRLQNGCAEPVPSLEWISEEAEDIKLIPYGCTNLRITEMPIV